jgi:hypothetical protein
MDTPHDYKRLPDAPAMPTEAALRADMDASDLALKEGLTGPLSEVLSDLAAAVDRIESRHRARSA